METYKAEILRNILINKKPFFLVSPLIEKQEKI